MVHILKRNQIFQILLKLPDEQLEKSSSIKLWSINKLSDINLYLY